MDPYVELRIIRRITDPTIAALLPAVIMLRRFDKAMLLIAFEQLPQHLDKSPAVFAAVFGHLASLEWINYVDDQGKTFLNIDQHLWPRLRKYYDDPTRKPLWNAIQTALAPRLYKLV